MPVLAQDSIYPFDCEQVYVTGYEHPVWLVKVNLYLTRAGILILAYGL
jgi:hypothetical protein